MDDEIGRDGAGGDRGERPPVTDLKIGYVGGGSRGWAYTFVNDLARTTDIAGEVYLYDVDYGSARRNERFGNWVQGLDGAVGDWRYHAVEDRAEALAGADFVVLSTQDPPAETMAHELDVPAEYGVYQPVGDTVGPGGVVRAMRTIPVYLDIGRAIAEHCPDAWVLNYTNPMTVCTRALYAAYPDVNAIGLCHEVAHVREHLADLVAEYEGVEPPARSAVDVTVKGVNHFTWIDRAQWRDRDLLELVDRHWADTVSERTFEPGDLDDASYFVNNDLVAYRLYHEFGAYPAAGDRHLAEFVPWFLSIDEPEAVQRWGIRLTPGEYRVSRQDDAVDKFLDPMDGTGEFEFFESGEEGVEILRALSGRTRLETNLNLPNVGQAPDLREGAVVETMGVLSEDAVEPLAAGSMPPEVRSLVEPHVQNQETLVAAAREGDVDRAYRAFLNDALVTTGPDETRAMFADLVEALGPYLTDRGWDVAGASVLG